jgi:hypothetical protein
MECTHHQYILTGSQPPTMSGCTISGVSDGEATGALGVEYMWGKYTQSWYEHLATNPQGQRSVMVTHHQYILTGSQPPTMSGCTISGLSDGEAKGGVYVGQVHTELV